MQAGRRRWRGRAGRRVSRREPDDRARDRGQAAAVPSRRAALLPGELQGDARRRRFAAGARHRRRERTRPRPRGRRDQKTVERFDLGERVRRPADGPGQVQRTRRRAAGEERAEPARGRRAARLRRGRRLPLRPAEAGGLGRIHAGSREHGILFRGRGAGARPEPGPLGHQQRGPVRMDRARRHQAGIAHPHAAARAHGGRRPLGRSPRGRPDRLRGPLRRRGRRGAERPDEQARRGAEAAGGPAGRRGDAEIDALARPDGRDGPGTVHRAELPGAEPERAVRRRRHVLDQAGQGRLGLVVGKHRDRGDVRAGDEHGHDEALHRFRGAPRPRIHARRRRVGADVGGRADRGHPALQAGGRRAGHHRLREGEGRGDPALGRVAGSRPAHGRGHGPVREMGRGRDQGRLHEPGRSGDGRLLREGLPEGG